MCQSALVSDRRIGQHFNQQAGVPRDKRKGNLKLSAASATDRGEIYDPDRLLSSCGYI